ncbi:MFS transporter [Amycolatopsis sp. RM579]|uniref:MFS transporter n=2 Tax=Amycolatopsis pithecellobii TaxID=664692 RepID=A0A6N7YS39_9PSEU|nr:MFS transporter [Amycolatopsis pithecellobii]
MLMPYLAVYLSGTVALASWGVGLVLGLRNFSQQGMYLVGGTITDRFGYRAPIIAGCALRVLGFALLGVVTSLPALIIASAATGFAGALFLPAVRIGLAEAAGPRRLEAFALSNVCNRTGILVGPLIGLALTGIDFRLTCLVSASVFAILTAVQIRALPVQQTSRQGGHLLHDLREVLGNRRLIRFALVMTGVYVLSFQIYLALPLETTHRAGGTVMITVLFATTGVMAIVGQLRLVRFCRRHLGEVRSLAVGALILALAFLPLALPVGSTSPWRFAPLLASAVLLGLGTMVAFPFEMDAVVALADDRLVATHYGLSSTITGVGILAGNLFTGTILNLAWSARMSAVPWLGLTLLGLICTLGMGNFRSIRQREKTSS